MIMNNENKKLSRNRERRFERKIKMNDQMKLFLSKTKSEKKNRIKQLEVGLVKINYANNSNKLQTALKELKKFTL